jgi:hypothetical protein
MAGETSMPHSADQAKQPNTAVNSSAASLTEQWQQLTTLIGKASASNANACRVLAVGHKACGGPSGYLAYSTETVDEAQLQQLAQRYTDTERQQQTRSGMMSNCMMAPEPSVVWVDGVCRLGDAEQDR